MRSNLALFCTPAINLFPKRADRIHVSDSAHEYHVVADRTRPLDFEIYEVTERRRPRHRDRQRTAVPAVLLGVQHRSRSISSPPTSRRAASRGWSSPTREAPRLRARATSGPKCFSSLVDPAQAPFSGDLRQLSIQALCTNRDLVLQMPIGVGTSDLSLDVAAPVDEHPRDQRSQPSVRAAGRRRRVLARHQSSVAQLSVARAVDAGGRGRGAARSARAVRGERRRQRQAADRGDPVGARRDASCAGCVRRVRSPSAAASRSPCTSTSWRSRARARSCSESVLDRYFARHVSINSFTETVLRSENRGEINRWGQQWGARPTL